MARSQRGAGPLPANRHDAGAAGGDKDTAMSCRFPDCKQAASRRGHGKRAGLCSKHTLAWRNKVCQLLRTGRPAVDADGWLKLKCSTDSRRRAAPGPQERRGRRDDRAAHSRSGERQRPRFAAARNWPYEPRLLDHLLAETDWGRVPLERKRQVVEIVMEGTR